MNLFTAETCYVESDWAGNALTALLISGTIVSYIPQHLRIIQAGTSIGFSPWFLLLGSTSSAAAMLNIITLQWPLLRCCSEVSLGKCIEITSGVLQVGCQWLMFVIILVLYMIYYPPHLKRVQLEIDAHDSHPAQRVQANLKSDEWRLSVIVSWATVVHLAFVTFATIFLLSTTETSPDPSVPRPREIQLWATFLGVSSGILAAVQYAPQLQRTYSLKLVGALSMPMMLIQSPGGFIMAASIAMKPGTDWTTWMMYAVAAIMQTILLVLCFAWKIRQRRLGIDDFGRPLGEPFSPCVEEEFPASVDEADIDAVEVRVLDESGEDTPLLKPYDKVTHKGGVLGWLERLRR